MSDPVQPLPRSLWVGVLLVLVLLAFAYLLSLAEFSRAHQTSLPVLGVVAPFDLTNQYNQAVTLANLTNHPWVADIIFTRCAGSCPGMTRQMRQIQDALPPSSEARLVTLTTDPDFDTAPVLHRYAEHYGADSNRWMFLTGTPQSIGALAGGSLRLGSTPVQPSDRKSPVDLFIHSTIFVVVDKKARLRAVFETSGDGIIWSQVQDRILQTLKRLEAAP